MLPEKLMGARFLLLKSRPYFAAALWALQPVKADLKEAVGFATLGVDRYWRLYYDPDAVERWDVHQLSGVLYHEINHLLRDHAGRSDDKMAEPRIWNIAGDCEINDDLKKEGVRMPHGGVFPDTFGLPEDELVEWYYDELMKNVKKVSLPGGTGIPGGGNCGSCSGGAQRSWEDGPPSQGKDGISPPESELIRKKVANDIIEHNQSEKGRGTIPAGLLRWAQDKIKPKIDWRRVLGGLIRRTVADVTGVVNYSYSRPSRRQDAMGDVIVPSMRRPIPRLAVVIDTSGSMSDHELSIAIAETGGILKRMGLTDGVTVLPTDAAVHSCKRVFAPSQIRLAGGGGTIMDIGIEAAGKLRPKPMACIVLTDGYTSWPEKPVPGMRTVGAIITDDDSPDAWPVPAHIRKVIIPKGLLTEKR